MEEDLFKNYKELCTAVADGRLELTSSDVVELLERLGDHCTWCADCNWGTDPDAECIIGKTWRQLYAKPKKDSLDDAHIKMVCPNCGATCDVVLSAMWHGDVYLSWNKEEDIVTYDVCDSNLDFDDYDVVCDTCGYELFHSLYDVEEFARKQHKEEN